MAVQTSYPGVYVQEIPSGVRTITGVSTSVTAFIGTTKRGPNNKSVKIFSYAEFERIFGGISSTSELSYSVKQYFLNGGTVAIIVRLVKDPSAAVWDPLLTNSLRIEALDPGTEGNQIEVQINYLTTNPDSTFNLVINFKSSFNPSDSVSEVFSNLSMNQLHSRFVETIVNASSKLVKVTRKPLAGGFVAGVSQSAALTGGGGTLLDVSTLVDANHNSFALRINGLDPVLVKLDVPADVAGVTPADKLATLCAAIQLKVKAQANGQLAISGFTCVVDGTGTKILMSTGDAVENSRIEVLASPVGNVASNLRLGLNAGGREIDAAGLTKRPPEAPDRSALTSGDIQLADLTAAPGVPSAAIKSFQISLDGSVPDLVTISTAALAGATIDSKMTDLADRIKTAVRALKLSSKTYQEFTCIVAAGSVAAARKLVLSPGSRGTTSSIVVNEVPGDDLAKKLFLLVGGVNGATISSAKNIMLQGGSESAITDATAYNIYVGSRNDRTGIYALEAEDLFNILCLPGVTDSGILMESEAYCHERRAFLIIDAPPSSKKPNEIATVIGGSSLPKSDYSAVYYPWIKISDPMNGGQLRVSAPSGTIAGLYARIDSNRGVWKAPAGTEASLTGVQGVEYLLNDRENGLLNPLAVNCVRSFPATGIVSWGSRTIAGSDQNASEYKYIPVRRTALFIEESLFRGLKWVVFEPNDEPLWAQIRLNVGAFMHNLFRQGAFQGKTKQDAYFVKCDSETTTQNDINLGIVNIWVGFAPLKPAEFVVLTLQQMAGQIQV
ncbi:MAG: phage tail sheath subtilisin-like domain-containing protein [Chlorobium sp.]|jgi:uncharacterized protein|nr:MAG: phage tail protein [Chlorobium sp.]